MSLGIGEQTSEADVSNIYLPAKKRMIKEKDVTSPKSGLTDSPSGKRVQFALDEAVKELVHDKPKLQRKASRKYMQPEIVAEKKR